MYLTSDDALAKRYAKGQVLGASRTKVERPTVYSIRVRPGIKIFDTAKSRDLKIYHSIRNEITKTEDSDDWPRRELQKTVGHEALPDFASAEIIAPRLRKRGYRGMLVSEGHLGPSMALFYPGEDAKIERKVAANPSRSSTANDLKNECRRLWDSYCERPNKTRLKAVIKHCEKMKSSKCESVRRERDRCMRAARSEAKELGVKL